MMHDLLCQMAPGPHVRDAGTMLEPSKEMERQTMDAERLGVEYYLDITKDTCPLTFVKTRLLIERMSSGSTAVIRLGAGEPLENVPRSVGELGHEILSLQAEGKGGDVFLLHLRKR